MQQTCPTCTDIQSYTKTISALVCTLSHSVSEARSRKINKCSNRLDVKELDDVKFSVLLKYCRLL